MTKAILTALALSCAATFASAQDKPEILTTPPKIPAGKFPDEVNLNGAANLDRLEIEYTYSSGRAYRLKFYDDRVSFSQLNTPAPTLTLPYLAREIGEEMYLVHWMVPGRIGHVSLVLDLAGKTIHGSALMPGQMELFEQGPISEVTWP
jgi:hypothetical protein